MTPIKISDKEQKEIVSINNDDDDNDDDDDEDDGDKDDSNGSYCDGDKDG